MRNAFNAATIVLAFALASPVAAQDFWAGFKAHNLGDYAAALREWRPLAEQGHAMAQNNLGYMYRLGQGVPQDDTEAVKWWRKAAEQGFAQAQFQLGYMYEDGQGVPQDLVQSHMWYSLGVPQDLVQSHMWYSLVASQGSRNATDATKSRDYLADMMTPEQLAEAQKLAREWKPK